MRNLCATILILFLICVAAAMAAVPNGITVQGVLLDNAGDPLPAGFKSLTFKVFDAEVGGALIWEETLIVNSDDDGLWTARLGGSVGMDESHFDGPDRWMEITVDDGVNPPEALSRVEMTSHAFAYQSVNSEQANSALTADNADLLDGLNSTAFALQAHGHPGQWSESGRTFYTKPRSEPDHL